MGLVTEKTCIKCCASFPATHDYFNRNNAKKDGLTAQCKPCRQALSKEQYAKHGEKYLERIREKNAPIKLKKALCKARQPIVCNKCKTEYPTKEGYFYHKKSGGFMSPCIQCYVSNTHKRYVENKEKINDSRREKLRTDPSAREVKRISDANSYIKHKERRLAKNAEYRARPEIRSRNSQYFKNLRNKPGFVEQKKEYLQAYHAERIRNPKIAEQQRIKSNEYWRNNREKYNAHVRNRRARLRQSEGFHTVEDIQKKIQDQRYKCYWCNCDISGGKHTVDHYIPIAKGGSNWPSNLVMACKRCNFSKSDKMPEEFIKYLARYAS